MKNLLLGLMLFLAFNAFAQNPLLPIDFDDPADNAFVGDGGDVFSLETALFAPEVVGKITGGGDQFNSRVDLALGTYIDMTTSNKTFTFEFYTTTTDVMTGLFQISNEETGGFPIEMQFTTDGLIGWQTVTLDFTNADNGYPNCQTCPDPQPVVYGQYAQVSIFTDFGFFTTGTYYFDDIAGAANGGVVVADLTPTVNATDPPPRNPEDVICIYSDYYTPITGINYNPFWGQSGSVNPAYDIGTGNNIMQYSNFNYQGTDFATNPQAAAAMEYLHVDMWTADATDVKVTPINSGTGASEFLVPVPIVTGSWSSVDLPIGDFTGMTWDNIFQMKFDGQAGVTPSNIYLDNIYFWKNPTVSGTDATLSDLQIDGTTLSGFTPAIENYAYGLVEGTVIVPQITSATPTDPNVSSVVITQSPTIPGNATVLVTAEDGITTKTYTVSIAITIPNSAPAPPTANAADVLSIYSEAYTNVAGTDFNPFWGQATIVTVDELIAGNNTLKYENLNYQGTQYTNQDVSGYEYLHVDFWTGNSTDLGIYLISPGNEIEHVFTVVPATWVGVDIPLTDFVPPVDLTDVFQFKVEGNGDVYFDNWYFWKTPSASTDWTGSVDSNWDDAGNWTNGVPADLLDATIPDVGANPYPIINGSANVNNLYIAAAAELTIASGADLTAAGQVDVDGSFYMSSNAGGISASFIDNGVTGEGTFYFNRDLFCSGSTANEADPFGWHYLAAPIDGLSTDDLLDYYVNQWDEVGNVWMNFAGTTPCVPYPTEYLNGVEAWSLNLDSEYSCPTPGTGGTIEFMGAFSALHTGAFSAPATLTGGTYAGWNMFGNPYPSAISPAAFDWTNFDMVEGVAIYDGCAGNYLYSASGNGYPYNVGPTQGFFVLAQSTTSFALAGTERVHDNTAAIFKDAVTDLLTIEATGEGTSDLTYIRFMEGTQAGVNKADFPKMFSTTEGLAQIYTTVDAEMLAVNALPSTPIVPMGFTSVTSGEYTISAIETSDFSNVVLEDRYTGEQTDLLTDSYTFNYTVNDDTDRFFIHFTPLGIGDNLASSIDIWSADHNIYVQTPEVDGDIVVYNMMGQEITRTNIEAGLNVVPVTDVNAFYVVKIVGSEVSKTGKVYVK